MTNRDFYALTAREVKARGSVVLLTQLPEVSSAATCGKALLYGNQIAVYGKTELAFWQVVATQLPQSLPAVVRAQGCEVLAECLTCSPKLVICGGGHISAPLAAIGTLLDFDVTVIDDREEFANAERFPAAKQIMCMPFEKALVAVEGGPSTYFVVITRGHSADRECLELILQKKAAYIGMIGSKTKVAVVLEQMANDGFDRARLDAVYAPIGLKIGAQTPAEIAVCIAAELVQVRRAGVAEGCLEEDMLRLLVSSQDDMVMATVIRKTGSAPRSTGARMLVCADGSLCGSIGGGAGEAQACREAVRVRKTGISALVQCDMTNDDAKHQGMVCGGKITVLLEKIT